MYGKYPRVLVRSHDGRGGRAEGEEGEGEEQRRCTAGDQETVPLDAYACTVVHITQTMLPARSPASDCCVPAMMLAAPRAPPARFTRLTGPMMPGTRRGSIEKEVERDTRAKKSHVVHVDAERRDVSRVSCALGKELYRRSFLKKMKLKYSQLNQQ